MSTYIAMAIVGAPPSNLRGTPEQIGSADTKEEAAKLASDWSAIHGGLAWTSEWTDADKAAHMAALRPNNGRKVPRRMTAEEAAAFNA